MQYPEKKIENLQKTKGLKYWLKLKKFRILKIFYFKHTCLTASAGRKGQRLQYLQSYIFKNSHLKKQFKL